MTPTTHYNAHFHHGIPFKMRSSIPRRWLITGVSSGLGATLLRAVLDRGDSVVGTLRDLSIASQIEALAPGRVSVLQFDVTHPASADTVVAEAVSRLGGLDVLVNNAGAGIFGPVEACSDDDFRRMMEVNYFGPVRVLRAALAHLRSTGGALINIASMAGIVAMPGTSPYAAAKHAMVGLSETLAAELAPLGVKVIIVLPGGFRTDFWSARTTTIRDDFNGIYAPYMAGQIRRLSSAHVGNELGDPAKLPNALFEALDAAAPPVHLVLGADALQQVTAKLERVQEDLDKCRPLATATEEGGAACGADIRTPPQVR
jgi:NAD(P)-dependent dehydrogenase (short-subunit alcohol dehydrogenase family)